MTIRFKERVLLAGVEAIYGTDPGLTAAANAILAQNIAITPMDGTDLSRELELATLGAQATLPVELSAQLTFEVELAPSGTAGAPPAWGPLLRGCGIAQTVAAAVSVTYNPVTQGHESLTLKLWIGSTLYALSGARGTVTMALDAQTNPKLRFEFRGLFTLPVEQAPPVPTLTNFQAPDPVTSARTPLFTIGGQALVMRAFSLALGNTVEGRFLVGAEQVIVTERAELVETRVEALPLTTWDPFQIARDQTRVAVALRHGTQAGRIAQIDVPSAQVQRPQGLENQQGIKEWPLRLVPLPVAGDDQWTLTLT
ncbi:MAG: hypothetical protein CVT80_00290 [Alphaproteobacteria bacterium HGW-Alphaproteobacteria-2]|nr:MAG: hypothetical protein CVT80_00290 [Alphaproteobacteria bacterium HGW-Alphaproteobacteria-2]